MKAAEATVGTRIMTRREWCKVPKGTRGVIDEDYGTGVMVAWDLPDQPLPEGYREHDGRPAIQTNILRDGFDKKTELKHLKVVT